MSEKQANNIQIAMWVVGILLTVIGFMLAYILNENNKRLDALEVWRQKHMEDFNIEAKVVNLEKIQEKHEAWMKEHSQFSQDQVLKINNNLSRIAAKLDVELR